MKRIRPLTLAVAVIGVTVFVASLARCQSLPLLPRVTPTTGLADSSLFLCTDSTKALTRACKFSDLQKRLAFKPWDSIVAPKIRAGTGAGLSITLQGTNAGSAAVNSLVVKDSALQVLNGRVGQPAYSFATSTGTGWYWNNSQMNGAVAGANILGVAPGSVNAIAVPFLVTGQGTAANPAFSFFAPHAGMFFSALVDTINFAIGGSVRFGIATGGGLYAPSLPSEVATKNAVCWDGVTFAFTQNAAATCTVSARRFKTNIKPMSLTEASRIAMLLQPSTYNERVGNIAHIGLIAEEADSVDHRLASRDGSGRVTSVNYEEVTIVLLKIVQDQSAQIRALQARLAKLEKH